MKTVIGIGYAGLLDLHSFLTSGHRDRVAPRRLAWFHVDGRSSGRISLKDCSRYDGATIRRLTAERGISPKSVRRAAAKAAGSVSVTTALAA